MGMILEELTLNEEVVMKAIWDCGKAVPMQDIYNRIKIVYQKDWTVQTVYSFLTRLDKKNYVKKTPLGRIYVYESSVTKRDYQVQQLKKFVMWVYEDDFDLFQQDLHAMIDE